jgi:hypothetical protein
MSTQPKRPWFGLSIIAFAIGFNAPFALLAVTFDYPGILRESPEAILATFHAGGPGLIWTWYAFGGVLIGEHLGQWLTVGFLVAASLSTAHIGSKTPVAIGLAAAMAIAIGTGEGLAIALGQDGSVFSFFTISGYLLLTLWLVAVGLGLVRGKS